MFSAQDTTAFEQHPICLSNETSPDFLPPFENHPQLTYLIDALNRKSNCPILLKTHLCEKITLGFFKALASKLKNFNVFFLDTKKIFSPQEKQQLHSDFLTFLNKKNEDSTENLLIINNMRFLDNYALNEIKNLKWKCIILDKNNNQIDTSSFIYLSLEQPTENDLITLLKCYRNELETNYNIILPEDIFEYAYSLSEHYLGGDSIFETAFRLLESGAARIHQNEETDTPTPILTNATLALIVSEWIKIPLLYLHHNKFKLSKSLRFLQQHVYGQDTALNSASSILQSKTIGFNKNKKTLCNLLLTGPKGVGKKTFAQTLCRYLYGNSNVLLTVNFNEQTHVTQLSDVFGVVIDNETPSRVNLLKTIERKPYSILLFENLDAAPLNWQRFFSTIFTEGYAFDAQQKRYDFRHTISIILTSTGAEKIEALQKNQELQKNKTLDLMQLVLNDVLTNNQVSTQEIEEHIQPALEFSFISDILKNTHIIPFFPLDPTVIEKIIHSELKKLTVFLEKNYKIELTYASEITKFLSANVSKHQKNASTIKKIIDEKIYIPVSNTILSHIGQKNRPHRLALLLNETGETIRCEFLNVVESALY